MRRGKKSGGVFCLVAVAVLVMQVAAWCQVRTGAISGTVKDSTEAVVPGAKVVVTNPETGQSRTVITGAAGRYRAPELAVGGYEVKAELEGFQTTIRRGIELTVGREAVVDIVLQVGTVMQEVVVTGEAPVVNTTSSTIGELVSEQQVHELPLNTRNLTELTLLSPGVTYARAAASGTPYSAAAEVKISVGGARIFMTGYLLDGNDITDSSRSKGAASAAGSLFGVETVREFQVLTSNYSAQYGRFAGGIVSIVTKSGTNELHGSVFEFHRNDNLDAANFFDNFFETKKPEFKRNQFGAAVGGPIRKDKTFFFGSYEGFREGLGRTLSANVPTLAVRQGNLPDGRRIEVNPAVKPFLDVYPLPNGRELGGGVAEYSVGKNRPTRDDFVSGRIDHMFSEADFFMGRYTVSKGNVAYPSALPGSGWSSNSGNHYLTLEQRHIFSPTIVNTVRLGFSRNTWFQDAPPDSPPLSISLLGGQPMGQISPGGGVSSYGNNVVGRNISNAFQYMDDLFISRGRHQLTMGGSATRYQNNDRFNFWFSGVYNFAGLERFLAGTPSQYDGNAPGSVSDKGNRQTLLGFYLQDDMKLWPRLTLNLGLRYELTTTPMEVNGRLANLRDVFKDAEPTVGEPFFKNPSYKNFAPRVGLAWDPSGDGKNSVRAGFGLFHDSVLFYQIARSMREMPPFRTPLRITPSPSFPCPAARCPATLADLGSFAASRAVRPTEFEPPQPYVMQWNVSLQRELPARTTLTVAYTGSRGAHLYGEHNLNVAVPEVLPDGRKYFAPGLPRRNLNFDDIYQGFFGVDSFYHGLQVSGRKRLGAGLQLQGAYTWSKCLDEASQYIGGDFSGASFEPQDPYDQKGSNHGYCNHHVNHNAVLNYVYLLPTGGLSGLAEKVFGGWQLSGIVTLVTGAPQQINLGSGAGLFDYNRDRYSSNERPSMKPGVGKIPILGGPNRYFDPNAFELQPPGFYGNVGRNTLIGPGVAVWDFTLTKKFALTEGVDLDFRSEFFNLFNRANFGNPATSIFSNSGGALNPTVGNIRSTQTTSRQIQFALKLVF